jgi:hypothetical protein
MLVYVDQLMHRADIASEPEQISVIRFLTPSSMRSHVDKHAYAFLRIAKEHATFQRSPMIVQIPSAPVAQELLAELRTAIVDAASSEAESTMFAPHASRFGYVRSIVFGDTG